MRTSRYDTHNWERNPHIALICAYISGDVYLPDSAPMHPFIADWERIDQKENNGETLYARHNNLFTPQAMQSDPTDTSLLRAFFARLYKSISGEYIIAYRGTDGIANVSADLRIGTNRWNGCWSAYDEAAIAFHEFVMRELKWREPIWLTGHSLGGYLAQVVAARNPFNTVAIVFNAPGIGGLRYPIKNPPFFHPYLTVPDHDPNIFNIDSSQQDVVHYAGGYPVGRVYDLPMESSCPNRYLSPHFIDHGMCEHALHTVLMQVSKYRDTEEKVSQQADDIYQKELAALNN